MNQPNHPMQPAPQYQQPFQQPKKRRVWPWVLGGVALFVVLAFAGCVALIGGAANEVSDQIQQDSRPVKVTYEITGDGVTIAGNITYTKDVNAGTEQVNGAPLPFTKEIQFGEGLFKPLSVVAQAGEGAGTITC
ncbi:MAG TPA: MmpS family transport accessory protein, partial [Pseudonocardiaceae bacterium]|nr:MmpS family transport accessory protein [Pseudonocardiaceae bacterium]